uniref:Uncharacterized protein n=1 Tax=Rhizophora mucronata TaxID=61149 RepID=A0A2P2NVE5_RHIMU
MKDVCLNDSHISESVFFQFV